MIHHGDCLEVMPTLPAESVDSIVTDPPYGLSFMGKNWDHGIPGEPFWREALRIAKPGTHLLAFGGTRTFHRLTCAIEDAGWEIRDCIMWVYGSGFPKSHNLSGDWQGWGTALKPAWEPIIVARKPLAGTVAQNVQEYGTGAVNVDAARIYTNEKLIAGGSLGVNAGDERKGKALGMFQEGTKNTFEQNPLGRWPANLIHDGSDEVMELFNTPADPIAARRNGHKGPVVAADPSKSAARFFYCAKASKADRDEGCEGLELRQKRILNGGIPSAINSDPIGMSGGGDRISRNHHPTVKPTALMRYLCRLVTPPGGTVLDPFCGSGSTGKAATLEGFKFIGIEREAEYVEIARARIAHARGEMPLLEAVR